MGLLKVSEAVSLALHAMAIVSHSDEAVSVTHLAQSLQVSQAHLSKVCQRLVKTGLLSGQRGPKGGLSLAKPSHEISLYDIYIAIEGEMDTCDCLLGRPMCHTQCVMGDLLHRVNFEVSRYFHQTTLDKVALSPEVTVDKQNQSH